MFAEQHALVFIDLAGIFVFASTGALVAVRKHLDIFGILVLAGTTGLGAASFVTYSPGPRRRRLWPTGAACWCR